MMIARYDGGAGAGRREAGLLSDLEVVALLLDKGADVHAETSGKSTALHYAAGNGHLEVIKLPACSDGLRPSANPCMCAPRH